MHVPSRSRFRDTHYARCPRILCAWHAVFLTPVYVRLWTSLVLVQPTCAVDDYLGQQVEGTPTGADAFASRRGDFVVVIAGVVKSSTTALAEHLKRHNWVVPPKAAVSVFGPFSSELYFFDPFLSLCGTAKGYQQSLAVIAGFRECSLQQYLNRWDSPPPPERNTSDDDIHQSSAIERVLLDKTPNLLSWPHALTALAPLAQRSRLQFVILLRDPVSRLFSHVGHFWLKPAGLQRNATLNHATMWHLVRIGLKALEGFFDATEHLLQKETMDSDVGETWASAWQDFAYGVCSQELWDARYELLLADTFAQAPCLLDRSQCVRWSVAKPVHGVVNCRGIGSHPYCGKDQDGVERHDGRWHPFRMCAVLRAVGDGLYLPQLESLIHIAEVPFSAAAIYQSEMLFSEQRRSELARVFYELGIPTLTTQAWTQAIHKSKHVDAGPSGGIRHRHVQQSLRVYLCAFYARFNAPLYELLEYARVQFRPWEDGECSKVVAHKLPTRLILPSLTELRATGRALSRWWLAGG